jgi:hypothetical protein
MSRAQKVLSASAMDGCLCGPDSNHGSVPRDHSNQLVDPGDMPTIVAALGKLDNSKGSTERHARHCQIGRANRKRF